MLNFYQHLPQYIDPIAFTVGSFSIRWYAISYIIGFLAVYLVLLWRIKKDDIKKIFPISNFQFPISNQFPNPNSQILKKIRDTKYEIQNTLTDFLFVVFFSSLIGGRIGYVLLYNFSYFISNPLSIISPFENGRFIGIYGMSYHGALVGMIIGSYIFLHIRKIDFWKWADFIIPAVPLGYFFGRIGNFLNGELYGKITSSPLGMYFSGDMTNLRYPSQLIEAILEGLVLFVILWSVRNKYYFKGILFSIYLIGYGLFRIFAEIFREPDPQVGFIMGYFTLGQLFSAIMLVVGLIIFFKKQKCAILKK